MLAWTPLTIPAVPEKFGLTSLALAFALCSPHHLQCSCLAKKLYVVSLNRLSMRRSYAEFEAQLQVWGARPLLDCEWGLRSMLPALEIKEQLRKLVERQDRILVVEVNGDWASRHALSNLGDLIEPRGGPARMLWRKRMGEES